MPWKTDDKQVLVLVDGNPVWIADDGKEMSVQGNTISRLNNEAKTHREAKEAAETRLAAYKDVPDPVAAKKAIDTLKDVDLSKMVGMNKLEEAKQEITRQWQDKFSGVETERNGLRLQLDNMLLASAFSGSKFMQERVAIPSEMMVATFGRHFKIEDNKVVPYDHLGAKLLSKSRMGEYADFDEALTMFVEAYPHKDAILRAPNSSGTGNNGGGGNKPGSKFVKRSDFEKMSPADQAANALKARTGEVTLID